jgi:hypothetical protein
MEMSGQLHAPAALTMGKYPRYPLDRKLGGSQRSSGHGGKEINIRVPSRNSTIGRKIRMKQIPLYEVNN